MVDIQPLRSPGLAAEYLVGYTVGRKKKAQQQYLTEWPGPRVRYSHAYFPATDKPVVEELAPEPGAWELVGPLAWYWQPQLVVGPLTAKELAVPPGDGLESNMYRKGSADEAAKRGCEDRPQQAGPGSRVLTFVVVTQIAG